MCVHIKLKEITRYNDKCPKFNGQKVPILWIVLGHSRSFSAPYRLFWVIVDRFGSLWIVLGPL